MQKEMRSLGRQVYLNDADLEVLEMLELLFDSDAGNTGNYTEQEEVATKALFDKVFDRK